MRRGATGLLAASLLMSAGPAVAQQYRFPITGDPVYPTAYMDHGGRDWNGGDHTYPGHGGSDYGVGGFPQMDAGRDVVAAAAGEVIAATDGEFDRCTTGNCGGGGGYGNHVRIRHGDGKVTIYAHLRQGSVAVGVGDQVGCGRRLGQVGSSGWSFGPHLHFEVRVGSGGRDDPFAGPHSGPLTYWVDQGAYLALPSRQCDGGDPPPPPPPPERRDDADFVSENVPDGTVVSPGERFTKVWRMRNSGNTTWTRGDSYLWTWDGEERLGGPEQVRLGNGERVEPGREKEWRVDLVAPDRPGRYRSYWKMDRFGTHRFGDRVWVEIVVREPERDEAELTGEEPGPWVRLSPGERFEKRLGVRNTGNTTWTRGGHYLLTWDGDARFSAAEQTLLGEGDRVRPGETHTFRVPMVAPDRPGRHEGRWRMDRFGTHRFGTRFAVRIEVERPVIDRDGDGHPEEADCDDGDPAVHPGAAEVCNGRDDDCDGPEDEDLRRPCNRGCGEGTEQCTGGSWQGCSAPEPVEETCNGLDDDCDGEIDEQLFGDCESACGSGVVACAEGLWGRCTAPEPTPETCGDGLDDDCDGEIDEDCGCPEGAVQPCGPDLGVCVPGTQLCEDGRWSRCEGYEGPSPELCDGLDNDCDGVADDGLRQCVVRVAVEQGEHLAMADEALTATPDGPGDRAEGGPYVTMYGETGCRTVRGIGGGIWGLVVVLAGLGRRHRRR